MQKAEEPKQEQQTESLSVNAPEKITVTKNEPKSGVPYTYHFNANDVVTGGAKSKFKANVEAIQVLQKIEAENRYATPFALKSWDLITLSAMRLTTTRTAL